MAAGRSAAELERFLAERVRLLLQLPVRRRAVLILRYWEQLTDAETAAVPG